MHLFNRWKEPLVALMLSAGLALTPLTASADLSSGLLIYYSFSGNADDVSGNGNDGTVSGAVLGPDNSSSLDSAFVFDGTDDFIEKTSPFNLNVGMQSWSVTAWINTSDNTGGQMIVNRYECGWNPTCSSGDSAQYLLLIDDGGLPTFNIRDDGSNVFQSSGANSVADGTWHHVAGILNQDVDNLSLFVDGLLIDTSSTVGLTTITDSGSPLEIGRTFIQGWASPWRYFNGSIDEVRIYNRALSVSEVGQLASIPEPTSIALFVGMIMAVSGFYRTKKLITWII